MGTLGHILLGPFPSSAPLGPALGGLPGRGACGRMDACPLRGQVTAVTQTSASQGPAPKVRRQMNRSEVWGLGDPTRRGKRPHTRGRQEGPGLHQGLLVSGRRGQGPASSHRIVLGADTWHLTRKQGDLEEHGSGPVQGILHFPPVLGSQSFLPAPHRLL